MSDVPSSGSDIMFTRIAKDLGNIKTQYNIAADLISAMTEDGESTAAVQRRHDYPNNYIANCDELKAQWDYFVAEGCGGYWDHANTWEDWAKWVGYNLGCVTSNGGGNGGNGGGVLDDLFDLWNQLIAPVTDLVASMLDDVFGKLKDIVDTIGGWIDNLITNITSVFTNVFNVIKDMLGKVQDWFAGIWDEVKRIWREVANWIVGIYESVSDWVVNTYENIKQWLTDIYEQVKEAVIAVYEFVKDTIVAIYEWVGARLQEVWQTIKDVYYGIGDWSKMAFDATIGAVGQWFIDTWNTLTETIDRIGEWFADMYSTVSNFITTLDASLRAGMEDLLDSLGDILFNVFNRVGDGLMNMSDSVDVQLYDIMANVVSRMLGISERLAKEVLSRGVEPEPAA